MTRPVIKTPRGTIITNEASLKAELKWNPDFQPRRQKNFTDAQIFVDSEVLRLCEPYTPLLTSMMIKSGTLGTVPGEGVVSWIAPYSKYQYHGHVMTGRAPKRVSATFLEYHGGGLRGSFWFERMKAVSGRTIIAGARRIAGKGKK